MGTSVVVLGADFDQSMGGLDESQAEFRVHSQRVGDALLNISGIGTRSGKPEKKDAARPEYVHKEFPKMMYHPEKGDTVVTSKEEQGVQIKAGWRFQPYVKPQVAVLDPATEKKALLDQNAKYHGEVVAQADTIAKLTERLEKLEKAG